jgi:hypothetical protein
VKVRCCLRSAKREDDTPKAMKEQDGKTSSWIKTPPDVRLLDGALLCDRASASCNRFALI